MVENHIIWVLGTKPGPLQQVLLITEPSILSHQLSLLTGCHSWNISSFSALIPLKPSPMRHLQGPRISLAHPIWRRNHHSVFPQTTMGGRHIFSVFSHVISVQPLHTANLHQSCLRHYVNERVWLSPSKTLVMNTETGALYNLYIYHKIHTFYPFKN